MNTPIKLLFVDDEENILHSFKRLLHDDGYQVLIASSGEEGLRLLAEQGPISVVISDYRMPGMNGVEFLSTVARRWPDTVRIVLSGYADTGAVIDSINRGAIYKFITKPWNEDELKVTLANAATFYFLQQRVSQLMREVKTKDDEIGRLREELGRTA